MQETRVQSLGWEDPLEKGMATHSGILAWRIPWMRRLVGYSIHGRKESGTTGLLTRTYLYWNLKRNDANEFTKQKETHRLRKQTYSCQGEGIVREFGMDGYTLLCLQWRTKDLL